MKSLPNPIALPDSLSRATDATLLPDRALAGLVAGAALVSGLLLLWAAGNVALAAGFAAALIAACALMLVFRKLYPPQGVGDGAIDWALTRAAADNEGVAIAITDRAGRLVCANDLFGEWFQGFPVPPGLPVGQGGVSQLTAAARQAWRDGEGQVDLIEANGARYAARVMRAGRTEDHLLWRVTRHRTLDLRTESRRLIEGEGGDRLGEAGIMVALVGGEGRIRAANRAFNARAAGRPDAPIEGRDFVTLLVSDREGVIRFAQEGAKGTALRLMQMPLETGVIDTPTLLFLIDDEYAASGRIAGKGGTGSHLQALLSMLPLGLALTDRDGRFLFVNDAFARAAGLEEGTMPVYPGDLVVGEDKAAVADTVRRFGTGQQALSGDIAVRLLNHPEEPVALTIAGARGLGEAAVLLSLKDTSEESKLKRQAEQATKMQAVGQLAGGVAHDFNNILTAIIGHCDLMMMRHQPGDSDYDDIQQIKSNSSRAANLTRQLLAFSRQQTLRPQVLQLPDAVSEVSNLLKRLLGETVNLVINHGRDLGAVRADPGQLEQVIVNLAVNARDAMQSRSSGGTLTIQTYALPASEVRALGSEILPIANYTALKMSDNGSGIPSEILSKIFEPFFTTKEVGKGTGLGLSTVYGIVKQSGGFIFADSKLGEGTVFTIYLPVHQAEAVVEAVTPKKAKQGELWGSGTILLVEDEDMVRAVAERALTRHGYTVLTATNGEEALEVLAGDIAIDLLVSDVVMPTMDGPTMVKIARETFPDMPILFMSGYAEEQLRKSIDLDRVAFLPKPFSVHQLAEAAKAAITPK
ncbi:hybrid sensor histidine kinase/response regulator [Sphingobium boeckii]|uniref:histidine kinase n=1 Tax=Sphingobium boeckii TaxID=1082345 RepID=A0A7W9AKR6_9SPHN|nr:response regulator [Sphingobium boeckii]MBB5687343.1 two-component system cell cycle sensor histidine kinase/response regulator CckA [Sphingobium boeckii]